MFRRRFRFFFLIFFSLFLLGCTTLKNSNEIPPLLRILDKSVHQALIVQENPLNHSKAKLTAWQRRENHWQMMFSPMDVVIGKNGLALMGKKREGDGRTPSGIFRLVIAFGYLPTIQTNLPYYQTTENDFWVDDPESKQYNQWVTGIPEAKSFERMKRDDDLYKYGIAIEYNANPIVPGRGSAIFIHVWRAPDSSTAGCVAMSEENIVQLLTWLDQAKNPHIILAK